MVATSSPGPFHEIPVIDVSPLLDDQAEDADKQKVASQLHAACRDVGFFYVNNHGITEKTTDGVLAAARRWFDLPEREKREIELSAKSNFRGYQPLGTNVTRYENGFARDWHEGIDLYREGQAGSSVQSPVHGANPWPEQLPEFQHLLQQYFEACLRLGQVLMRGIAMGLGLPENYFETQEGGNTTSETSYWVARVLHYPPISQGDSHVPSLADSAAKGEHTERSVQLSCGEHTDYGLLTLVNQEDGLTALQVKNQAGQWINASPIPGTLVCNIGDMLKVYTNGLYTPTAHRVINANPTKSRVSLPFFYECSFDTLVKPISSLIHHGESPRFDQVQYGKHLLGKVLTNFELESDSAS